MRTTLIVIWALLPAGLAAYHYGPGQRQVTLDAVADVLAEADALRDAGDWAAAAEAYERALGQLPDGQTAQQRHIRLSLYQAQMQAAGLPQANRALEGLLEELTGDAAADPELVAKTRSTLAESQYYMTWLLRLEGADREVWWPYVEGARQNYRRLAETADAAGKTARGTQARVDLDASIRLARMDLAELQGLPLPSQ